MRITFFLFLSRSTGIELCLNCLILDFLKSLVNPISRSNLLREILYWPVAYLGFKPPINEVQPAIQCKTSSLVPTILRHGVFFVRNKYTSTTTLFTVYYHCSCVSHNSLNMARNAVFFWGKILKLSEKCPSTFRASAFLEIFFLILLKKKIFRNDLSVLTFVILMTLLSF